MLHAKRASGKDSLFLIMCKIDNIGKATFTEKAGRLVERPVAQE